MENFLNPIERLREVVELLAPDGLANIEIPNAPSDDRMLAGAYKLVHPIYFNVDSLLHVCTAAGLQSIERRESDVLRSEWRVPPFGTGAL